MPISHSRSAQAVTFDGESGGVLAGAAGANFLFQVQEFGFAGGGGAAGSRFNVTLLRGPGVDFGRSASARPSRFQHLDLVTDLGVQIGSRAWLRGLGTCMALCYAAWSFAPGAEAIAGASPLPLSDAHWEESRALAIAPLALGADTGRRMAPTDAAAPLLDTPERPSVDLFATLGRGDRLPRALERAGVARSEAGQVARLVAAIVPLEELKPGTMLDLTLGRRPDRRFARPLDRLAFRARFDLRVEITRVDGALRLTSAPIAIDETPLRIRGAAGSSLYRSARAAGVPAKAIEAYLRAVAARIDVGEIGSDDRYDIIIEHRRAATGETESGKLLYAGLERSSGRDLQMMQWEQDGKVQWFEASGVGKSRGILQRPVPGAVSSNFGMRRHPILGYSRMHKGMDFRAGYGTPILAATDGRVSAAGWAGGYGRQVRLRHGEGLTTSYSHMSRITVGSGESVRQGQVIGYVGSTGLSTGPHLHYELHRNGVPINPLSVKFTSRAQLSGEALAGFKSRLRILLAVPAGTVRGLVQQAATGTQAPTEG